MAIGTERFMNCANLQTRFLELNRICRYSSLYGHFYPLDTAGPNYRARLKLRQMLVADLEELTNLGAYRKSLLIPGIPPKVPNVAISISHCQTWAGFIFQPASNLSLGFDIEQRPRITKNLVGQISDKEEVKRTPSYASLWGAKEAAFKAIPAKPENLFLKNIYIEHWCSLGLQAHRFSFCVGVFRGEGYAFEIEDLIFTIARTVYSLHKNIP